MRRARRARGLSQRDLAYLAGCSQATVSLIERGKMTSLTDSLARAIARRLGVACEDLFAAPRGIRIGSVTNGKRANRRRATAGAAR